jgi:uncharacterized protein YggU (UPF0235/DUF167 family)
MAPFRVEGMRVTFRVSVKPRAAHDRLRFDHTGRLRLEIRAAPSDGDANLAITRFFAKRLRVPQDSIEIAFGTRSRQKLIRVVGHPPYQITDRLMELAHEHEED